jgi:CHASE3 domain sensor protein
MDTEKKEREQRAKEYKEQQTKVDTSAEKIFTNAFHAAADSFIQQTQKKEEWKEKIRLSDCGKEDAFMDAIIEYMETLENDTRRIEACNNIIKICRNISVELQRAA